MKKDVETYVKKVKERFKKYFVGYGVKNKTINVIIDDRDIRKMTKKEVSAKSQKVLNELSKNTSLKPKLILTSELNNKNIWNIPDRASRGYSEITANSSLRPEYCTGGVRSIALQSRQEARGWRGRDASVPGSICCGRFWKHMPWAPLRDRRASQFSWLKNIFRPSSGHCDGGCFRRP